MSRRHLLLVVPAVAAALTLAACGGETSSVGRPATSSPTTSENVAAAYAQTPVAQIEKDVEASLKGASSLHLAGSIVQSKSEIDFDVSVDTSGNCTGTMGLHNTTIQLLGASGAYYFRAPRAFWRSETSSNLNAIWSLVGGKWVKMGSGSDTAEMSALCNLSQFTKSLFKQDENDKDTKVVGPSEFLGQPTVELSSTSDGGTPDTIQVLATAPHYPVRVDAGNDGEMTFSKFDEKVKVTPPPSGETVDLSHLGG